MDATLHPLLFSKTLKFIVLLTIVKPHVQKHNNSLLIKGYFELELGILVELKDYLKK